MKLTKAWSEWLDGSDFKWSIFLTIHYYRTTTSKSARNLIQKIKSYNNNLIDRMFFINEREKSMKGVHTHLLIQTSENPHHLIKKLDYLNSFSNTHYEFINNNEYIGNKKCGVGMYVTKFIDKEGIDYDLL